MEGFLFNVNLISLTSADYYIKCALLNETSTVTPPPHPPKKLTLLK